MKKLLLTLSCLVLAESALAAGPAPTPSVASLNGTYSFNVASPQDTEISASISCPGTPAPFTVTGTSGDGVKPNVIDGIASFDGAGNVSITATNYGEFDRAANVAALQAALNCSGTFTVPPIVFSPPTALTASGTYSIASDGTGTMTLTITSGGVGGGPSAVNLILRLAALTSKGLAKTVLLHTLRTNNSVDSAGIAVLQ